MEMRIRDQVIPVLALLEATEGHLGTWNIFLGVFEVLELEKSLATLCFRQYVGVTHQGVLLPLDTFLLVGVGI